MALTNSAALGVSELEGRTERRDEVCGEGVGENGYGAQKTPNKNTNLVPKKKSPFILYHKAIHFYTNYYINLASVS